MEEEEQEHQKKGVDEGSEGGPEGQEEEREKEGCKDRRLISLWFVPYQWFRTPPAPEMLLFNCIEQEKAFSTRSHIST
jgi:hypothetical protein